LAENYNLNTLSYIVVKVIEFRRNKFGVVKGEVAFAK